MAERIRAVLLKILRVPGAPDPPSGSRQVRIFRAAPNYYRYRLSLWLVAQIGALAGLVFGFLAITRVFADVEIVGAWIVQIVEIGAWAVFVAQLPFSYALLRLDFEMRWYLLSDRSLRIREGTVSLREKTMTYANVQQITVRQNPLQRFLGIADVQVRSAGGGGSEPNKGGGHVGESMHEAWFRGVDDPEEIRTAIRERVRQHRDAGLGDPDEAIRALPLADGDLLSAARELREEARHLRSTVAFLSGAGR
ncbi:MAG: PH domain-containing protein [Gemmatimonadota bacterium]